MGSEFDLRIVAYDPWNATDFVARLEKIDGLTCVKIRRDSRRCRAVEIARNSDRLKAFAMTVSVLRWNIVLIRRGPTRRGNIKRASTGGSTAARSSWRRRDGTPRSRSRAVYRVIMGS